MKGSGWGRDVDKRTHGLPVEKDAIVTSRLEKRLNQRQQLQQIKACAVHPSRRTAQLGAASLVTFACVYIC